jgi:uncharacterized protein (TIGR03000 family)
MDLKVTGIQMPAIAEPAQRVVLSSAIPYLLQSSRTGNSEPTAGIVFRSHVCWFFHRFQEDHRMYSIVLMMALSSGADTPAGVSHGHTAYRGRDCYGCHCYGCYGCSGCYGCHCYGGGRRHHHRGNGCYCYGCYGYGCYCHGCYGYACYGCSGCHGGCYYGGDHGAPPPAKGGEQLKTPPKAVGSESAAPATVVVMLPGEAKLSIDGAATTSTSTRRVFVTPSLEPGQAYHYTLTGELVRAGQTVTATKQVEVRAGQETQVSLDFSERVARR